MMGPETIPTVCGQQLCYQRALYSSPSWLARHFAQVISAKLEGK